MPYWIITFFLGICTLSFCATLPSISWVLWLIPLAAAWLLTSHTTKQIWGHLLAFAGGAAWFLIYAHQVTSWSLPPELEGKKILITGYIAAPPSSKAHGISFVFQTVTLAGTSKRIKLKLGWYGTSPPLIAGDKWQLLVRLKRPHGMLNPGGFDIEKHLLMHHIRATGYVVNSEANQRVNSSHYHYPLARFRHGLMTKIEQALMADSLTPIIMALVTGAEDKITPAQWQVMRDTGTSYLVAIAGLHIGLVATIFFMFSQFLWRLSSRLPLILPAKEAGIISGLVLGFIYGAVSGFSIPTQRSLVMLIMFSLTVLWRRHTQPWNAWLWSLLVVLIINPLAILTIGFWLSFTAVASIIYVNSNRLKQPSSHLKKFWRMQISITLALLPFTLLFFQQLPLVTIIANLIAMPGVCLVIVPMSLVGALGLLLSESFGGLVLWWSAKLLHLVWWWLTLWANSFGCNWYQPIYNWWILGAISVGVVILLAPRGFPARFMGLLWLTPLFFYTPQGPNSNLQVWFTLLDVGQGLAALVQTKNHTLLYDTGPAFFDHNAGTSIIIPYLRHQGINKLDTMVVSHGDSDHSGGALAILKALPVSNILTSVPEKFTSYVAKRCVAGQQWQWDGVDFQILSPPHDLTLTGNNASCVLKITTGEHSLLLPGDIERPIEAVLGKNYGAALKSTILVAPHHGSATSSTEALIDLIKPQYVIFAAGYKNRFRLPHKKVVARYIQNKATLLNVSQTGAITFKFADKSAILRVSNYRKEKKRFWHDN